MSAAAAAADGGGGGGGGGLIAGVVEDVFRPGVGRATVTCLNRTLLALFACLCVMLLGGFDDVHTWVMLFLAGGLFVSLNWFLSELAAADEREEAKRD